MTVLVCLCTYVMVNLLTVRILIYVSRCNVMVIRVDSLRVWSAIFATHRMGVMRDKLRRKRSLQKLKITLYQPVWPMRYRMPKALLRRGVCSAVAYKRLLMIDDDDSYSCLYELS